MENKEEFKKEVMELLEKYGFGTVGSVFVRITLWDGEVPEIELKYSFE